MSLCVDMLLLVQLSGDVKNMQPNTSDKTFAASHKQLFAPSVDGIIAVTTFHTHRGPGPFCQMSATVTYSASDPPGWFCGSLWKVGDSLHIPTKIALYYQLDTPYTKKNGCAL